jgi:cytochrome P450
MADIDERELVRRTERFPRGAAVTLEQLAAPDCDVLLDELRSEEPVSWIPELGGWLVSSRELARTLLLPRSDVTVQSQQNMVRASLGRMMLTVDAEEHDRMRGPFEGSFRPREVGRHFEHYLRELSAELVGAFIEKREVEIGSQFAAPFAVRTAGRVLGLELGDVARIDGFYSDFAGAMEYTGDPEPLRRADDARRELNTLLRSRLKGPTGLDSFATDVAAQSAGQLSEDEMIAQLRVVMFGAIETIQASVMNTLLLLQLNPSAYDEVLADRSLLSGAVSESVRLIPPVAFVERWAKEPLRLGGVDIGTREFIGVSIIGANRDPAIFESPQEFQLHRENSHRALSFSFGEHHCIGFHLARLQTVIALEEITQRLGRLSMTSYQAPEGFAFRRPGHLTMGW